MNDILEEIKSAIRKSRLLNLFVTQKRKLNNPRIETSSSIINSKIPGLCALGENALIKECSVSGRVEIARNCAISNSALSGMVLIGDYTTINSGTIIIGGSTGVKIGKFCSIAPGCYIQTYNHSVKRLSTYNMQKNVFTVEGRNNKYREGDNSMDSESKGGIVLGNDVWIGTKTTILTGVEIGDGAVVGANSLVNKSVPPYSIVGGVPAKILKYRFSEEVIEELLRMKWWNWSLDRIGHSQKLFTDTLDLPTLKNFEE